MRRPPLEERDWALSVGIGQYVADSRLAALPGARDDAIRFYHWVGSWAGGRVPRSQRQLILSARPQPAASPLPTEKMITSWFERLHREALQSSRQRGTFKIGRRLYVFFAGHGASLGDARETSLYTADAVPPEDLYEHVAARLWVEWFRKAGAFDEVILVMDCCRTGLTSVSPRGPNWPPRVVAAPDRAARHFYAFAVADGSETMEIAAGRSATGELTAALLRILRRPRDRPLTANGLKVALFDALDGRSEPSVQVPENHRDDFVLVGEHQAREETVTRRVDPGRRASLVVHAGEALTRLDVWSVATEQLVGTGQGSLALCDLPLGSYRLRSSVGPCSRTITHRLDGDGVVTMDLLPLDTSFPLEGAPRWPERARAALAELPTHASLVILHRGLETAPVVDELAETSLLRRMSSTTLPVGDWTATHFDAPVGAAVLALKTTMDHFAISVPVGTGRRTEVFVDAVRAPSKPEIAIRVVPSESAVGSAQPGDRAREALRLALGHDGAAGLQVSLADTRGDAVAALLALSVAPDPALVTVAEMVLGESNEDVRAHRVVGRMVLPPLTALAWARSVDAGRVETASCPLNDRMASNRVHVGPWLAWDLDRKHERGWIEEVANASWPGWSTGGDAEEIATLETVARRLRAPAEAVRRRVHKAPPVDRLVRHDIVAFVGATHDQLGAALAIAFGQRERRKWRDLALWFLGDEWLEQMCSAGRRGASLKRARTRAMNELLTLLPRVADSWRVLGYRRLEIGGEWHFASLWDWRQPGGWAHISPYRPGQEVRTTAKIDVDWPVGAEAASSIYREAVLAYDGLEAITVFGSSEMIRR